MVRPNFWSGKRVFLTGHTGFKGSWLSLWLRELGAEVTGYARRPPTDVNLFESADVAQGMTSVIGEICDAGFLAATLAEARPDIVIHMAAQPLVRYSYDNPVETYSTNVMGLVALLEAVRQTDSVRAAVNVTSDKCYENREWLWGYRETDPMGGFDPYSSSKGCAELVTAAYTRSFFNPERYAEHGVALASARAGNVIGGGDWACDRLIPDIMRALAAHEPVKVRNPQAIRPWQHVLEPLRGYLMLAERLYENGTAFAGGWNFGPSDTDVKPVQWIVENLTRQWGEGAAWTCEQEQGVHEATHLKLDCSKAQALLGWTPVWGLEAALDRIVCWHQAHARGESMRAYTLAQIRQYQSAVREKSGC